LVHQILELFLLYLMVDPFHQNDIILLTTNRLEKEIFIFRYLSFFSFIDIKYYSLTMLIIILIRKYSS
jgi:hypothetical protein